MRLKCIKLAGFKSFVDATSVQFPGDLCAVVGPNGCGKSNIIDAVRWVMGESSARNLRGELMSDVIFDGAVNRQPVGQASSELIFDNRDGKIGGEYAGYAEIAVKRQLDRDGQSVFFLNGSRCRRRDITDIFLGTGLGSRSYAIIEQGMITRLVESRPEELRVFIEEAAGVSKYRERRRETESRMRHTNENLERLADLREELERQLQHLQRQARSAEKYGEFKQRERTLKAQLQVLQWQALDARMTESQRHIGAQQVKRESVLAEQQHLNADIEKQRLGYTEATDACTEVQERYYELGAAVTRIEQSLEHQRERARELAEDLQATQQGFAEARGHLEGDRSKQQQWQGELAAATPDLERLQAVQQASAATLLQAETAMQAWQQDWDQFNRRAAAPRQQSEVQQSRIQQLEQVLQRGQQRLAALEQEQTALADGPAADDCVQMSRQQDALEQQIGERQQQATGLLQQVNSAREQRGQLAAELDRARGELQTLRGRQAALETLQQAAAGVDTAVADWLRQHRLQPPRLLEQLQVEADWQHAVETVLGEQLRALCVEQIDALESALAQSPPDRLVLVDGSAAEPAPPDSLAARVQLRTQQAAGAVTALLGTVLPVEDLAGALQRRSGLQGQQSLITRDGIWVGRNWLRVVRPASDATGVIARQQALEQLTAAIEAAQQRCSAAESALETATGELNQLEQQGHGVQEQLQAVTREHAQVSARLSAGQAKIEQLDQRREAIARDIEESRRQLQDEQQELTEARRLLALAIDAMQEDSLQEEQWIARRDAARAQLQQAQQSAGQDRDAAQRLAMQQQSLQAQLQSIEQSIARTDSQLAQLLERRNGLQQQISSNEAPLADLQQQLAAQLQQRVAVETELGTARSQQAAIEQSLRAAETGRAALEQRHSEEREQLQQLELAHQTLQVQRETLEQQLAESGHELAAVVQSLPEQHSPEEWTRALEQVGNRIARLGPINLAAIDEYRQQQERKHYLDAQNEDLEQALATLQAAIRKIDRETRSRFRDTFDEVNNSLQELFPSMFGGGSACLEMTGDDLLSTGVTIMAHPPGKKNATIQLLSGGEKALTAIALVFSIFRLNPAPFCMLDEVDAPLDDANTERYVRLVKQMSDTVQFIFITHNKITMEAADQLLGITMQEPGVSRLVSVDVAAAAELAAS